LIKGACGFGLCVSACSRAGLPKFRFHDPRYIVETLMLLFTGRLCKGRLGHGSIVAQKKAYTASPQLKTPSQNLRFTKENWSG
jgi:hypothetical protein